MDQKDLKEAGLKITQPRMRILELLENSTKRHFSAEEIYQILIQDSAGIGLATVYRVLTQFETAGLVVRHNFESGQSVFELNHGDHHDHIVDVKTGRIVEFHDEIIETRQREIAKEHGFKLVDHSLIMYGEPLEEE
ncbi:MAG: ferric iron uptake transcriptional regulator [Thiotrichaceae bacterium]